MEMDMGRRRRGVRRLDVNAWASHSLVIFPFSWGLELASSVMRMIMNQHQICFIHVRSL